MIESLWFWLNTPPAASAVLDPFGAMYFVVFGCGFLASAYFTGGGAERLPNNPVLRSGARHWANVGLWISGSGLFFFAFRALQINPLSFGEPIWLLASVIVLIVAVVRGVDWWRAAYREPPADPAPPANFHRQ